ncbi:MAG: hypothetical protein ACR2G6_16900 [Gemmatimonadaceae bacterium]
MGLSFRKGAGCESCFEGLGLVATIYEGGSLRGLSHGPVDLAAFVVVLADLGVEAAIDTVLEDVPSEGEDHGRALCVLNDVLVRPGRRVGLGECPRRGVDAVANGVRKRNRHERSLRKASDRLGHTLCLRRRFGFVCSVNEDMGFFGGIVMALNGEVTNLVEDYSERGYSRRA